MATDRRTALLGAFESNPPCVCRKDRRRWPAVRPDVEANLIGTTGALAGGCKYW